MKPTLDLFDLFDLFSSCTEEKFRVRLGVFSYLGGIVVMMTTTLPNTLEGLLLEGQKLYKKVSQEISELLSGSLMQQTGHTSY